MAQASAEKLEHTGPTEKEQSRQPRVPDYEKGENEGERKPRLGEREGDQSESMVWKG